MLAREEGAGTSATHAEVQRAILNLGPGESQSIVQTFSDFILAQGTTKRSILIDFEFDGKIIRSASISGGASFTVRSDFSGETRVINVTVTNRSDAQNTVRMSLF